MLRYCVLFFLIATAPAAATTINFESGFDYSSYPFTYVQDGFRVSNVGPTGVFGSVAAQPSGVVSITNVSGNAFTLEGFSAGTWNWPQAVVSITSTLFGGGAGPTTSIIAPFNALASFDLSSIFGSNLLQQVILTFAGNPYGSFLDNIKVAVAEVPSDPPAVPLPAALPLFLSGIGGLGALGWRRVRKNLKDAA